jgi:hypothetical protein
MKTLIDIPNEGDYVLILDNPSLNLLKEVLGDYTHWRTTAGYPINDPVKVQMAIDLLAVLNKPVD